MIEFVLKRLAHGLFVLIIVSILVFLMVHLTGDAARMLAPIDASETDIAAIRTRFGLDRPLHIQYMTFVKGALSGDLGESFRYRRPALGLVVERLPATLKLTVSSLALAVIIAIPLGIISSVNAFGCADYIGSAVSLLSISIPSFWLGMVLIMVFANHLRWLPPSGTGGLSNLILPAVTMSAYSIGLITRLLRSDMHETLQQEFILVARSKGLSASAVILRHALKNCIIPTVTVLGMELGTLLGGSVIIETVFAWPGVGWLMVRGIENRDLPLIRAAVLVVGSSFVLINLLVDILYGYLDPRIKYQ